MADTQTLLYLDVFGPFDASRSGLIEAFCEAGISVVVANFSYFHAGQLPEAAAALVDQLERSGTQINGILSINTAGLSEPITDYAQHRGLNHVVWFVDMPYFFPELHLLNRVQTFVACTDYNEHPKLHDAPWLPFAGAHPVPLQTKPDAAIGFLGGLHPIARPAVQSMHGLIGSSSGHNPPGKGFYELMKHPSFLLTESWSMPNGTQIRASDFLNFLSSSHRLQNLSYFYDMGLEIQGPADWIPELWVAAPQLLGSFKEGRVSGRAEMREYLSRYEICLNIFHLQNMNGGPNFRSFDAASNYTPCLSQHNDKCALIFPHGEAALYYRNVDEARYLARNLIGDRHLRERLTANAASIVRSDHTFAHRVKKFCKELDIEPSLASDGASYRHVTWDTEGWKH